ncbi:HAMP domain-containing sensor histidine kinase [uncultured Bilophila sp.]|uniref:sensor histidine kinase n=1 Tax=uncultured Bilophila sp. TaxID=529385 RepID=UPI0026011ECB|nr:HAMP domain-containing sensor histidine kinase [uncultured Bilophila sp.]
MLKSLYSKILAWLLLNMLLIALAGGGFVFYVLFSSSHGLVPASLFSSNVENVFRVLSTELQYRPTRQWSSIVRAYDKPGLQFHLVSLDDPWLYFAGDFVPLSILETAQQIPRTPFTLCPDPSKVFKDNETYQTETGLAPTPPAIFARLGSPTSYWYGRTLFVPDASHEAHYLLLAVESDDFTGQGLFFNFQLILTVAAGIFGLSCIWWVPFLWHLARPLLSMANYAERIAAEGNPGDAPALPVDPSRQDEIGRLSRALSTMTRRLNQQMAGQRQFIRHIAHELNTSLGHCDLGLAVLEKKSEGEYRERVRRIMRELDNLTQLTDDVLEFLRAQSSPQPASCEEVLLPPLLADLRRSFPAEADIRMSIPDDLVVWGDKSCIRRAVSNALRNAVTYAGSRGPIRVETEFRPADGAVLLRVVDSGDGVPEAELPSLVEPFFRGAEAQLKHPGGSGLGLAIIKNSLEQCGGSVVCANEHPGFSVSMIFPCNQRGT